MLLKIRDGLLVSYLKMFTLHCRPSGWGGDGTVSSDSKIPLEDKTAFNPAR